MTRYVVLLRAVNVGGSGKIAMADLRTAAATAGLTDGQTLLQSGNLVGTSDADAGGLQRRLADELARRAGLATQVFIRSADQWEELIAANPLHELAERDPAHVVLFVFGGDAILPRGDTFQAATGGGERIFVRPHAAYVAYPAGIGRSKLTVPLIERRLGVSATGRNWSTVRKIAGALGVA